MIFTPQFDQFAPGLITAYDRARAAAAQPEQPADGPREICWSCCGTGYPPGNALYKCRACDGKGTTLCH